MLAFPSSLWLDVLLVNATWGGSPVLLLWHGLGQFVAVGAEFSWKISLVGGIPTPFSLPELSTSPPWWSRVRYLVGRVVIVIEFAGDLLKPFNAAVSAIC